MRVGGVDVAFHHVVAHETVNDIATLAFGRTENQGMPEQVTFIDERVGADPSALPKYLKEWLALSESARTSNFWPSLAV